MRKKRLLFVIAGALVASTASAIVYFVKKVRKTSEDEDFDETDMEELEDYVGKEDIEEEAEGIEEE